MKKSQKNSKRVRTNDPRKLPGGNETAPGSAIMISEQEWRTHVLGAIRAEWLREKYAPLRTNAVNLAKTGAAFKGAYEREPSKIDVKNMKNTRKKFMKLRDLAVSVLPDVEAYFSPRLETDDGAEILIARALVPIFMIDWALDEEIKKQPWLAPRSTPGHPREEWKYRLAEVACSVLEAHGIQRSPRRDGPFVALLDLVFKKVEPNIHATNAIGIARSVCQRT